jgi:hypothetical protein
VLQENPCQHPVIIFRNVKFEDLAALVDFMYQGEVNVVQDQLASFLTTAELLAVQGLSDGNGKDQDSDQPKEVRNACSECSLFYSCPYTYTLSYWVLSSTSANILIIIITFILGTTKLLLEFCYYYY